MIANIQPLDFVDTSYMAAALLMKHAVRFKDDTRRQDYPGSPHHDTETILLRGPFDMDENSGAALRANWQEDVPHADRQILANWPTARTVIGEIAASHERRSTAPPEFGKIMVVSLRPGGKVDWHSDQGPYAEAYDRFHVCLVPSPGAFLFSGGMAMTLQPGVICWVNNRTLHSAINVGPCARVHLIFDVRKPTVQ